MRNHLLEIKNLDEDFDSWCEQRGVVPNPLQRDVCLRLIRDLTPLYGRQTGKSFIMDLVCRYVDDRTPTRLRDAVPFRAA